jgi:hypothetical protein
MVYEHHNYNKEDIVIQLHDAARAVEKTVGSGELSKDIRRCADRLNELLKSRVRKNG